MHVGTVDNHSNIYKKLNKDEKSELENIYSELFNKIRKDTCQSDAC